MITITKDQADAATAREFVRRLLKLNIRDRFKNGYCRYCESLCMPKERMKGRCPNCRSMRRAMAELCASEKPAPAKEPGK